MADLIFWVVSYDIKNDRRRNRVAKELKDYGERVQYSVFECILTEERAMHLARRLERVIEKEEDSIRFYRICEACQKKISIYGQGKVTEDEEVYIV